MQAARSGGSIQFGIVRMGIVHLVRWFQHGDAGSMPQSGGR